MEPIFLFILLAVIGFSIYYWWPRKRKETTEPIPPEHMYDRKPDSKQEIQHNDSPRPTREIKYDVIGRVSKPMTFNWTREKTGSLDHLEYTKDFALKIRCEKKILDLQKQLARHDKDGFSLAPNDLIRYNAMIEVLKAMIQ